MNNRLLYSRREACALLGISLSTLVRLIESKQLRPKYVGDRPLFPRTQLEKFAGVRA